MDNRTLFKSIGEIDDRYIVSAQSRLDLSCNDAERKNSAPRRHFRKLFVSLAAAVIMLLASFTVVMAANEDFRETVFALFHTPITEEVPGNDDPEYLPPSAEIDELVNAYYISVDDATGIWEVNHSGVLVHHGENKKVYAVEKGKLIELEMDTVSISTEWNGKQIVGKVAWYLSDNVPAAFATEHQLGNNVQWDVSPIDGSLDKAKMFLYLGEEYVRHVYPLIIDLSTGTVSDPFSKADLSIFTRIENVQFSANTAYALVWGTTADEPRVRPYICDPAMGTLSAVRELVNADITNAYFLNSSTVLIAQHTDAAAVSYWTYHIPSDTLTKTLDHISCENPISGTHGLYELGGRYALHISDQGDVCAVELATGYFSAPFEGFSLEENATFFMNSEGTKAFYYVSDPAVEGLGISGIGMLNFETAEFTVFDRENYNDIYEWSIGWLGNNQMCVSVGGNGSSLYIYEFTR